MISRLPKLSDCGIRIVLRHKKGTKLGWTAKKQAMAGWLCLNVSQILVCQKNILTSILQEMMRGHITIMLGCMNSKFLEYRSKSG